MKIEYDAEADALYIQLRESPPDDNIDLEEGISVDLEENKNTIGIEILDVSKKLSKEDLSKITIENLTLV
jgi:uncharacterized protein YuzE